MSSNLESSSDQSERVRSLKLKTDTGDPSLHTASGTVNLDELMSRLKSNTAESQVMQLAKGLFTEDTPEQSERVMVDTSHQHDEFGNLQSRTTVAIRVSDDGIISERTENTVRIIYNNIGDEIGRVAVRVVRSGAGQVLRTVESVRKEERDSNGNLVGIKSQRIVRGPDGITVSSKAITADFPRDENQRVSEVVLHRMVSDGDGMLAGHREAQQKLYYDYKGNLIRRYNRQRDTDMMEGSDRFRCCIIRLARDIRGIAIKSLRYLRERENGTQVRLSRRRETVGLNLQRKIGERLLVNREYRGRHDLVQEVRQRTCYKRDRFGKLLNTIVSRETHDSEGEIHKEQWKELPTKSSSDRKQAPIEKPDTTHFINLYADEALKTTEVTAKGEELLLRMAMDVKA